MARPRKEVGAESGSVNAKRVGKKPWKPAAVAPIINGVDAEEYRTRWVNSADPINMQRKQAEGWQILNETTLPGITQSNKTFFDSQQYNAVKGNGYDGAVRYREMVGMVLPMEDYEARQEYIKGQTEKQTRARVKQSETAEFKDLTQSAERVGSQLQDDSTRGRLVIE